MRQKRNFRWKPTFFSLLTMLILLGVALKLLGGEKNPLLNEKNSITLYREVPVGQMPEFRTEDFFPDEDFDYAKVTYDTKACDVDTPGTYIVPVFYDGETTNCVVEVTVKGSEEPKQAPEGSGEFFEAGTESASAADDHTTK